MSLLTPPQEFARLEQLQGEIDQITAIALTQLVSDTATKDQALTVGAQVKRMRKALEDRRKEITAPLQDLVKQIIAFAQKLDAPLEHAETHIRRQATLYAERIAESQRQEQRRIQEQKEAIEAKRQAELKAAAFFNDSLETQLKEQHRIDEAAKLKRAEMNSQEKEIQSQAVKGTREEWNFEITDRTLVPDQYWVIDESALRIAVKNFKLREIPGVRIYSETKVSLRSY